MSTQAQRDEEWERVGERTRALDALFEELHGEIKGSYSGFNSLPGVRDIIREGGEFQGVQEHMVARIEEIIRNWKAPDRLRQMFEGEDVAKGMIATFYDGPGAALQEAIDYEHDPFSTGWFFARYTESFRSESAEVSRLNNGTVTVDVRICDGEAYDYVESLVWEAMGGDEFAENGSKALVELGVLPHEVGAAIGTLRDTLDPLVTRGDNCIEMDERLRWDIDFTGVQMSLLRMRGELMMRLDDVRQKALVMMRQMLRQAHGKDWSPRFNTIWDRIQGR